MSSAAMAINDFFYGFDHGLLSLYHGMEQLLGGVLTPLMKLITLLGEKGLVFFLLAVLFALFADTRDTGVCIFGAVCCGALITNIILKDAIARPRPFESSDEYYQWWVLVGSPKEDGFSFPSGHVTACAAGMAALCCMKGKKLVLPSAVIVFLMALSRNYLMAHYPSDVLVASIVGVFSAVVAWFIAQFIFRFLGARHHVPVFEFMLDFDIRDVLPFRLPDPDLASLLAAAKGLVSRKASPVYEEDEDADMKTYGAENAGRAAFHRTGARLSTGSRGAKAAPSGRHEVASKSKKKGLSVPGSYKGKHEL